MARETDGESQAAVLDIVEVIKDRKAIRLTHKTLATMPQQLVSAEDRAFMPLTARIREGRSLSAAHCSLSSVPAGNVADDLRTLWAGLRRKACKFGQ